LDLDGNPRVVNGKVDMGCYQYAGARGVSNLKITGIKLSEVGKIFGVEIRLVELTFEYEGTIESENITLRVWFDLGDDPADHRVPWTGIGNGKGRISGIPVDAENKSAFFRLIEIKTTTE
jgi:hypothetical protein